MLVVKNLLKLKTHLIYVLRLIADGLRHAQLNLSFFNGLVKFVKGIELWGRLSDRLLEIC